MSDVDPRNVTEMVAWLRAHPKEPFLTSYSGNRLLVGTRNDDGELRAWECAVKDQAWELNRRPARGRSTRTRT